MPRPSPAWLLLISNLTGRNPTLRMRLWRALKTAGAGLLRDGSYLLPNSKRSRQLFEQQRRDIRAAGGQAHVLSFDADSKEQTDEFIALFDRAGEYRAAVARVNTFKRELAGLNEIEARQRLAAINRDVAAIIARDFFYGASRTQMEAMLVDAESAVNSRFAPNEPHSTHRKIQLRDRKNYRNRTWATRERLWVDRAASAWLIRRFIDPEAKFLWLKRVRDCPKQAVGFDFDGAEFTHVDCRVTFEVLMLSFGLERDHALCRFGAMVHHLDVGGIPTAEGPGFSTIMAGARMSQPNDDALLLVMTPVLDSLYVGYLGAVAQGQSR